MIEITSKFYECRDVKDNFLLDLSVLGNADYLITGDVDLLVLNPFNNIQIISYNSFQNNILKNL